MSYCMLVRRSFSWKVWGSQYSLAPGRRELPENGILAGILNEKGQEWLPESFLLGCDGIVAISSVSLDHTVCVMSNSMRCSKQSTRVGKKRPLT